MQLRMWVITLVVVGCAHKKAAAPAPSTGLDLAGKHANYRDWRGADACKADAMAHWADLEAMNALLTEFLAQTGAAADAVWTSEQIATLESAQQNLGPALDGLDSQTSAVTKCKFPKTSGVDDSAKTADELSQKARKRLTDAPGLLPTLKAHLELNKWKAAQADAIQSGKESWCGAKVKPGAVPDVFYGAIDETGKTEWHFCDGVKVITPDGGKPEVHSEDPKKKPHNAKGYIDAALKYPASEIQKAPRPQETAADGKTEKPAEKPEG